jgi:hypothetical protein
MKKTSCWVLSLFLGALLSFSSGLSTANAAGRKVDCAKVMSELQSGKKVAEVAKDLKISKSSVYHCRKEAKTADAKESAGAMASPASKASPAAH